MENTGKVETPQQPEPAKQPADSQVKPVGSQEKPDAEGTIIGLKSQLKREKEKTKSLESRVAALESSVPSSEETDLGWKTEDDAEKGKKELASLQKKYKEALDAHKKAERKVQLLELSQKYGIPYEVISDATTEFDLLEKVEQWRKDKTSEGKSSAQYETGNVSPIPTKGVFSMSSSEFTELDKKVKAEARARKLK